ncbi:MAG: VanZ family protein [Lachnospiraceae bacterium]|nr:VanZ family protein [Lachnospiraceae bacterium]
MVELSYLQVVIFISVAWLMVRAFWAYKNKRVDWKRELLLLTVYICIVVITRLVYFPLHHVDGHIGLLKFDAGKIWPLWINLRPFTFVYDRYDGWQINIIGNVTMFIPVGICWGVCFKKLNSILKVTLAGFGYSLLIELSQLLLYERGSDIDDLILNTTGAFIGALVYFGTAKIIVSYKEKWDKET